MFTGVVRRYAASAPGCFPPEYASSFAGYELLGDEDVAFFICILQLFFLFL